MRLRWSAVCVALAAAIAACSSSRIVTDQCFILVAQIVPDGPELAIGDTLRLRATFGGSAGPCVPADTTPAGLAWTVETPGALTIDSISGVLTAWHAGWSQIIVKARNGAPPGWGARVLGTTFASVLEPPGADSLTSLVANLTADSVTVVLNDANGAMLRTATLPAQGLACWRTALSDSVQYSAQIFLPGQSAATSLGAKWVVHAALAATHTWHVTIDPQSSSLPSLDLAGTQPDRSC